MRLGHLRRSGARRVIEQAVVDTALVAERHDAPGRAEPGPRRRPVGQVPSGPSPVPRWRTSSLLGGASRPGNPCSKPNSTCTVPSGIKLRYSSPAGDPAPGDLSSEEQLWLAQSASTDEGFRRAAERVSRRAAERVSRRAAERVSRRAAERVSRRAAERVSRRAAERVSRPLSRARPGAAHPGQASRGSCERHPGSARDHVGRHRAA